MDKILDEEAIPATHRILPIDYGHRHESIIIPPPLFLTFSVYAKISRYILAIPATHNISPIDHELHYESIIILASLFLAFAVYRILSRSILQVW